MIHSENSRVYIEYAPECFQEYIVLSFTNGIYSLLNWQTRAIIDISQTEVFSYDDIKYIGEDVVVDTSLQTHYIM